ncbi:hypothetical protein ACIPLC_36150 [Kitasatospora sp. NPDC086801]|uniref:hypothetical protein n=1 Tax=Kitasatospora sp. NPDC086801 TaxID=3364066 RepID=UPI0038290DCB
MTSTPDQTPVEDDVAVALAAIEQDRVEEVERAKAELAAALEKVGHAEERLAQVRAGSRIPDREAVSVHSGALAAATAVGQDVIAGRGTATKADFDAARERADAVQRGLAALGYPVNGGAR